MKRTFWPFWLITLLLWITGCGGPAPETAAHTPQTASSPSGNAVQPVSSVAAGQPEDGDWLIFRFGADAPTLNPILTSLDADGEKYVTSIIYEGLLLRDNETWEFKPNLAESYEISEDKLTFTFKLRRDVKFTDGTPMTADDVKFSFDILMDPKSDTMAARNYFLNVDRCEKVDDYTVRFVCKEAYFKTIDSLGEGLRIMPRHIFSQGDFNTHPNNRKPIGTGPYVFESWETGQQITLVRNEQYWGPKPHLLKRVYRIITDDNAALQVLERGELDAISPLTADQWVNRVCRPEFEAKFNKHMYNAPMFGYIGWNMRKPQFADKRVRQALTMLLDRKTILDTVMHGMGTQVTNSFFLDSIEYNKDLTPWPFDPERAKKQLEEAGWIDTNNDGIREKDGQPFKFDFLLPSGSGSEATETIATVFKEELKKAGVDMNIRQLEWATFIDSVQKLKFEAFVMAWFQAPNQDPYQLWHSSQAANGSNYPGFCNTEVDQLIEQARKEFDHEKRAALYRRMNAIIFEEQPYTFLFCRKEREVVDKRFQNVKEYRLGLDPLEWWVPKALQRYK